VLLNLLIAMLNNSYQLISVSTWISVIDLYWQYILHTIISMYKQYFILSYNQSKKQDSTLKKIINVLKSIVFLQYSEYQTVKKKNMSLHNIQCLLTSNTWKRNANLTSDFVTGKRRCGVEICPQQTVD
jgi:hypothetical protein